jgi:hypothetical protein
MKIIEWDVPIVARWYRSTELKDLHFGKGDLVLRVIEEDTDRERTVVFKNVQAFRGTTEECAAPIIGTLPQDGGFFQVQDSPWLTELGRGEVSFLDQSKHYIVACYDEILEIVAWDALVEPV